MNDRPFVHNLEVFILQEVTHFALSGQNGRHQLSLDFLLFLEGVGLVPFL